MEKDMEVSSNHLSPSETPNNGKKETENAGDHHKLDATKFAVRGASSGGAKSSRATESSPTVDITDDLVVLDEIGSSSDDEAAVCLDEPSTATVSGGKSDSDVEILDDDAGGGGDTAPTYAEDGLQPCSDGASLSSNDLEPANTLDNISDAGASDVEEVRRSVSPTCVCDDCPLQRQVAALIEMNNILSAELRLLKSRRSVRVECKNSVTIDVKFPDSALAKKYGRQIKKCVVDLIDNPRKSSTPQSSVNGDLSFVEDKVGKTAESKLDKHPVKVPYYKCSFTDIMDQETADQSEKDTDKKPPATSGNRRTCFNCMGDHTLNDCTVPRDNVRILNNRNEFMVKKGAANEMNNRYHESVGDDQIFSKFKPGQFSEDLRNALGLARNALPNVIYRMRELGYPPGWMAEAEVSTSGLTMYDSQGKEIAETADGGEVEVLRDSSTVRYDPALLPDFPGFNVKLPSGIVDNHKRLGFLPMQDADLKCNMSIPVLTPYKRRKSSQHANSASKRQKTASAIEDMDVISPAGVDDFDDDCQVLPSEVSEITEVSATSPPKQSSATSAAANTTNASATDEATILTAADPSPPPNDSETTEKPSTTTVETVVDDDSTVTTTTTTTEQKTTTEVVAADTTELTVVSPATPGNCAATPQQNVTPLLLRSSMSKSISMCFGSPSLIIASAPRLPPPENFTKGVSEHMPFENLPDAVGCYDKMKDTIDKIRKLAAAEEEEDDEDDEDDAL